MFAILWMLVGAMIVLAIQVGVLIVARIRDNRPYIITATLGGEENE